MGNSKMEYQNQDNKKKKVKLIGIMSIIVLVVLSIILLNFNSTGYAVSNNDEVKIGGLFGLTGFASFAGEV